MSEPERMTTPRRQFPVKWVIRITGSLVVLGLTLWLLPRRAVWQAMTTLPLRIWLLSLVAFMSGHVVSAVKWRLLMASDEVPLGRAVTAHFAGLTANLCLPGAAGGDVVRAGLVLRQVQHKAPVAVGSLADRVLDTLGLLLLAALGTASTVHQGSSPLALVLELGGVVLAGVLGAVALVLVLPRLPLPPKLRALAQSLSEALSTLRRRPFVLLGCLLLSMSVQSLFIGVNILLARSSGLYLPAAAWFFAWPLAKLLALAPVSLGGLGVREASLAALLAPLGGSPSLVVAVGLLWQSILFASGLLGGGVLLLFTRFGPAARAQRRAAGQAADLLVPPESPDRSVS